MEIAETFTNRDIVVTALTGVAATNIMGETVHSALRLNAKSNNTKSIGSGNPHTF